MLEHYNIMNESKASDHSNKQSTSRVRIMHIISFLVKSKEFWIDLVEYNDKDKLMLFFLFYSYKIFPLLVRL